MASDLEVPLRNEPLFDQLGQFTIRYAEFFDLLGVNNNEIFDRLDAIDIEIIAIKARLDALEALQFIEITATANHTTTRNEIVTCTNTSLITITLDATPDALEEVHVVRAGSVVKIDGNGSLITGVSNGGNGVSSFTLNVKGQGVQMVSNSVTGNWHIQ